MPDTHIDIQTAANVNPAATTVNNSFYYGETDTSRMAADFERLREEIRKGVTQDIIDELKFYITELPGTKSVEEKLADGRFNEDQIFDAVCQKDMYARRAEQYQYYPSAQQIIFDLFSSIKNAFKTDIFPMIACGEELTVVMQAVRTNIVLDIKGKLEKMGSRDEYLHFSEDHIYGMIYYLTGMCHLNWAVYSKEDKTSTLNPET